MKVNEVIIVEGKYDKIRLSNITDTLIIETNGFGIFKDKEKRELIKTLAEKKGLIILTDSDSAGMMIRNHIKSFADPKYIKNAYIPDIYGKERRKTRYSKEGKLGVEGIPDSVLIDAIMKAGATQADADDPITLSDFYEYGLTGTECSAEARLSLQKHFSLPERMSTKGLLQVLNCITTKAEFIRLFEEKNNPGC